MNIKRIEQAKRIQALLKMTGLSRREFAKKSGIPNSSLQTWDTPDESKYEITKASKLRLIKAFKNLGIECSYEWLETGNGQHPHSPNKINNQPHTPPSYTAEDQAIKQELNLFLQQDKDSISYIIPDDAMAPYLKEGDTVAGIRLYGQEIDKLIDMECIVLTEDGDIFVRSLMKGTIENYYRLAPLNPKTLAPMAILYDVRIISAAPILWIRRKWPLSSR